MFQSLRINSQFFIFHKGNKPYIEVGSVVNVSQPVPKFTIPQPFAQNQDMVVDVIVNINGQNSTYQRLPANQDIADFGNGNIVVASSRDAMNAEITSLRQKSIDIINSKEYHEDLIKGYDVILQDLNPEFAEKQRQQNEIDTLKGQMMSMSKDMADLINMNKELMAKLGGIKKE